MLEGTYNLSFFKDHIIIGHFDNAYVEYNEDSNLYECFVDSDLIEISFKKENILRFTEKMIDINIP